GPLQPRARVQPRVGHSREHRRQRAHLVPRILGARVAEVMAVSLRDLRDDPEIVARFARRLERLSHTLHSALAVRHRAFAFAQLADAGSTTCAISAVLVRKMSCTTK